MRCDLNRCEAVAHLVQRDHHRDTGVAAVGVPEPSQAQAHVPWDPKLKHKLSALTAALFLIGDAFCSWGAIGARET